jgi:transmembrane sensor
MSERETPQTIHDRAVEWVARLDRADGDATTQAELQDWLGSDERRRGAFFRAQAAWAMLDRASVLRTERADELSGAPDRNRWWSRRRLAWESGALAAAGAAMLILNFGNLSDHHTDIETAIGEIRRVPLGDGSLAAVNTQTKLSVTIKPALRQVALAQGEAWFQVAKDRARPFIVEAGDVRVKAVGTAFSIRRTEQGAQVQVTEGVVEVWSVKGDKHVRRISAGARTFVSDMAGPAPVVRGNIEIDRTLAWRNGQLVFEGNTLGEAAAEFNRYNRIKVEVADPGLAREEMIGRFRTNEPEAFARAAASILGARVERGSDKVVLTRK